MLEVDSYEHEQNLELELELDESYGYEYENELMEGGVEVLTGVGARDLGGGFLARGGAGGEPMFMGDGYLRGYQNQIRKPPLDGGTVQGVGRSSSRKGKR